LKTVVNVLASVLECFSVDRFVGVKSEKEMEDMAFRLNDKKLFYAGL
jgi:hypothetical protein